RPRARHSFPTRRSSDLADHRAEHRSLQLSRRALRAVAQLRVLREPTMMHRRVLLAAGLSLALAAACHQDDLFTPPVPAYAGGAIDRKSTRLNSSHLGIS